MNEREAMEMSGAPPFYIHRNYPSGGWQQGFHGPAQVIRSFTGPNSSLPMQSSDPGEGGGSAGSAFQGESHSSISQHLGANVGGSQVAMAQSAPVKKKRGRPRKYAPDGATALVLSSLSSPKKHPSITGLVQGMGSATPMQKRGRGRPPGTGKKQLLASYGQWVSSSAGTGFIPHVITISTGEDIAIKLSSFSQQGPRAVCVTNASGAVSTMTLHQTSASSNTVKYEGLFEIISLAGIYIPTDKDGSSSQSGSLCISVCTPDGSLIGGKVAGALIAASDVLMVVGSFACGSNKTKKKDKSSPEHGGDHEQALSIDDGAISIPRALQQEQSSQNNIIPVVSGWPGSRPMDLRNLHTDIDLSRSLI